MKGETRSTRQWVFCRLEEDILADRLPPGTPLVEMKLAAELGVSRTPVREALRQLEQEGLVTFTPNRGMVVRGIRPEDVHDAYLIRSMLEGQAVRWAVERMTDAEMKGLLELIALMEYHAGRRGLCPVGSPGRPLSRTILHAVRQRHAAADPPGHA